jgi:hypothetical protein
MTRNCCGLRGKDSHPNAFLKFPTIHLFIACFSSTLSIPSFRDRQILITYLLTSSHSTPPGMPP